VHETIEFKDMYETCVSCSVTTYYKKTVMPTLQKTFDVYSYAEMQSAETS